MHSGKNSRGAVMRTRAIRRPQNPGRRFELSSDAGSETASPHAGGLSLISKTRTAGTGRRLLGLPPTFLPLSARASRQSAVILRRISWSTPQCDEHSFGGFPTPCFTRSEPSRSWSMRCSTAREILAPGCADETDSFAVRADALRAPLTAALDGHGQSPSLHPRGAIPARRANWYQPRCHSDGSYDRAAASRAEFTLCSLVRG